VSSYRILFRRKGLQTQRMLPVKCGNSVPGFHGDAPIEMVDHATFGTIDLAELLGIVCLAVALQFSPVSAKGEA